MLIFAYVLSAIVGYLLGSISFAVIISSRVHHEDVRTKGSGNAGMTNMLRNYGKKTAALTMLGDTGKGLVAVLLGRLVFMLLAPGTEILYGAYIAGVFTIVGHMFPVFFGFKGGKGIATSLGVILGLAPVVAVSLLAIFLIVLAMSKMVSLGSIIGISFYPVLTLLWSLFVSHRIPVFSTVCAVFIAGMVVWMHRANIGRIRAGTEYKFGSKKEAAEQPAEEPVAQDPET